MEQAEQDKVRNAYLRYASAAAHNHAEQERAEFWAVEAMYELVSCDVEAAWAIVSDVVRVIDDEAVLAYVAAGPLEDLLIRHGPLVIDRIESAASDDSRVMRAVMGVWGRKSMDERVARRLDALVGDGPGG